MFGTVKIYRSPPPADNNTITNGPANTTKASAVN